MEKEKLIDNISQLLREQHHNARIDFRRVPDSLGHNGEWLEITGYLIEDFAQQIKKELSFDVVQMGRSGASLCIDAYSHNNGHHSLNKALGWYENGTGQHVKIDIEDCTIPELKRIFKDLQRYAARIRELMTAFYDECKYQERQNFKIETVPEHIERLNAEIAQLKDKLRQRNRQIKELRKAIEKK